jgi:hypothetical protein
MNLSLASRASSSTCDYNAINITNRAKLHHTGIQYARMQIHAYIWHCSRYAIFITESAVAVVLIFFYYSAQRVILSTRAPEINRPLIGRETSQLANTASGAVFLVHMRRFSLTRLNMDFRYFLSLFGP